MFVFVVGGRSENGPMTCACTRLFNVFKYLLEYVENKGWALSLLFLAFFSCRVTDSKSSLCGFFFIYRKKKYELFSQSFSFTLFCLLRIMHTALFCCCCLPSVYVNFFFFFWSYVWNVNDEIKLAFQSWRTFFFSIDHHPIICRHFETGGDVFLCNEKARVRATCTTDGVHDVCV